MVLRGDLRSLNLASVFQELAQNSQTGTLALKVGDRRRYLWFEKGLLRLVGLGASHGPSIPNGLLATGKLKADQLGKPDKRQGEHGLLKSLLQKGAVTEDDIKAALSEQMTELVCDAFLWTDAEFEFSEGDPDEASYDTRQLDWDLKLPVDGVIMEALRRSDEWTEIRKVVLSSEEIFQPLSPPTAGAMDAVALRVFAHVDGERRLGDIQTVTHLGQFAVFKSAATLLRAGAIQALPVAEAANRARVHAKERRWSHVLGLAHYALQHERHSPELRQLSAQALEGLDKPEEAAAEYRLLLAELTEQKRLEEAVEACRRIVRLTPRDTFTQERLFQLLLDLGRADEALVHGEGLAASLKRAGLPDRARAVYERLVARFSDKDEIVEELAEIARQMGDKDEAIALYRKLHARAVAKGDEGLIVQRSRTLLRLDPTLEDVAKQRLEIETGIYRRKRTRARRVRWILAGAAAGAIVLAAFAHDMKARSSLSEARSKTLPMVEQRDYAGVLKLYNRVADRAAWSFVATDARTERDEHERRYAGAEFPRVEKLDQEERIPEAVAGLDALLELARLEDVRGKATELRRQFLEHRTKVEHAFLDRAAKAARGVREGNPAALDDLKGLAHPLALPALRMLAEDSLPAVKVAAIRTLGELGSNPALLAIVESMSLEAPGSEAWKEAEAQLKLRTKADPGPRPHDWEALLLGRGHRTIQAVVSAPAPVAGLEDRVAVEWRLLNVGREAVEVVLPADFAPVFTVKDSNGTVLKGSPLAAKSPARSLKLGPGEFVGGSLPLKSVAEGAGLPGKYLVRWTGKLGWPGGESSETSSLPVTVEILPRQGS